MTASLDPIVAAPVGSPGSAWKRPETMETQRRSIAAVAGYSSLSIMFLSNASAIRISASGSIHVVTKVARLRRELPSRSSSSWISRYVLAGSVASSGRESGGLFRDRRPV